MFDVSNRVNNGAVVSVGNRLQGTGYRDTATEIFCLSPVTCSLFPSDLCLLAKNKTGEAIRHLPLSTMIFVRVDFRARYFLTMIFPAMSLPPAAP
jgi:hypothetical protein